MLVLGLTGGIASGKSTALQIFKRYTPWVQDSDKVVHKILRQLNMDRKQLSKTAFDNNKINELEKRLHPLVRKANLKFINIAHKNRAQLVVIEVPLLFEAGFDKLCDYTIVINTPEHIQKQRALKRSGMDEDKYNKIIARQIPLRQKLELADFAIKGYPNKLHTIKDIHQLLL